MTTGSVIGSPDARVLEALRASGALGSAEVVPGELGHVRAGESCAASGFGAPDTGQGGGELVTSAAGQASAELVASAAGRPSMPLTAHGGAVAEYGERFGTAPLDFSANVNPFGMAPAALRVAREALAQATAYPDPESRELRRALGAHLALEASWVLPGNGAADLIWRLAAALRPRRGLVLAPTFSEYELALRGSGCGDIRHYALSREACFVPDEGLLEAVAGCDMAFVCNPNNPTGVTASTGLLERLARRCHDIGCVLVVDECFNGFLDDPDAHTLRPLLGELDNLAVLSAFTKLYGMPGLRLGYLLSSNERLLARVRAAGQAWPVSNVAQAAGVAALGERTWVGRTRAAVSRERARLRAELAGLGLAVLPGEANYLCFSGPAGLYEAMAQRGVIIRDCRAYEGLDEGDYRVAVRLPDANDRLVRTLRDSLGALYAKQDPCDRESSRNTDPPRNQDPSPEEGSPHA